MSGMGEVSSDMWGDGKAWWELVAYVPLKEKEQKNVKDETAATLYRSTES